MIQKEIEEKCAEILKVCKKRRKEGQKKYGNDLDGRDMREEMIEELYDVINYAMFEIIKIRR